MSIINWYFHHDALCGDVWDGEKYVFVQGKFSKIDAFHVKFAGNVLELKDEDIDSYFKAKLKTWRTMLDQ
jgi:hypothetical protein